VQHLLLSNTNQTAVGVTTRPGPTLDLNFAASLNTVDQVSGQNLVTFNRSTSGTYVDSTGVLRSAVTNLLLRSEEFETTWGRTGILAFGSGSVVNAIPAPNGSITADLITEDTATSAHAVSQGSVTSGVTYTISVYAKAAGRTRLQITGLGAEGQGFFTDYNLSSVTVSNAPPGSSIADVGNGWCRCVMPITASSTAGPIFRLRDASGSSNYTGDGTSGIYLWGAQLEQSTTVGEYIPTTSTINSAPRFDHDPTTLESLGLLVEEQRTNLITDSSLTTVGGSPGATITSSTETNPENISFCQRILSNPGTPINGHRLLVTSSSANTVTASVFVKKDTHRYVYIGFGGIFNSFTALFDIEPGVTTNRLLGQGGNGTYTNANAGYQDFPNGWVRIWASGTTPGTDGLTVGFSPDATTYNITNWSANGTEAFFVYGAQYEDNVSFPTSYIPTTTAAVTRSADLASITGTAFSGWYRQDEGTMSIEYRDRGVSGTNRTPYALSDGTANNRIQLFLSGTTVINNRHIAAGINTNPNVLSAILNAKNRHAITSAVGSCTAASNGTPSNTTTPAAMPIINRLNIGINSEGTGDYLNSHVARITYYPVRIPNPLLQVITL
jgi:hypothetical protein